MPSHNGERIAIVQRGTGNVGKTATIRLFHDLLFNTFPNAVEEFRDNRPKELRVIVIIGNVRIGIETLGDPSQKRQQASLQLFVDQYCEIVVTASRTSGTTVETIEDILGGSGYTIEWRTRTGEPETQLQQANRDEARWMLNRVRPWIEGTDRTQ